MKLFSKFFKVAQEGATTDGRAITREQIEQMAKNYSSKKYGARIWLEHLRGILPDSQFAALGDVSAVRTGEENGKLGLYAQLVPTPELVAMNRKAQKIFSSIEMDPDFSDTGEAYLVGLAVTDSPASLGTEAMAFSANAETSLFEDRKQNPENVFSAASESVIEFEEAPEDKPTLLSKVKSILERNKSETRAEANNMFNDISESVEAVAESQQTIVDQVNAFSETQNEVANKFDELSQSHKSLEEQFNELSDKLKNSQAHYNERPAANGTDGTIQTDC